MTALAAEALSRVMDNRVASTRITGARFLGNLAAADRIQTASKTSIDWDVDLGGEAAAVGPVGSDTVAQATATIVPANLRIGRHRVYHRFNISRVAIKEAAAAAPADLANLFNSHVDRGLNAIARRLNNLLFTGDGTAASAEVVGLSAILNPTAVYAGLDPATYPSWTPILNTNGTARAFTRDLMLALDEAASIAEQPYDMVVAHPSVATKYQKVFDTLAGNLSVVNVAEAQGLKRADLGHGGRYYNGFPIIEDPQAPTNCIILLDSQSVDLMAFELDNAPDGQDTISDIVINRSYGIPIHIAELPSSNSVLRTFEFYVLPQLRMFNRKAALGIMNLS